ncbi:MAG: hypothetical protein ACXWTH_02860 [Methylosarcina sp.]
MTEDQSENHDKKPLKVTVSEHMGLLDQRESRRLREISSRLEAGFSNCALTPCNKRSLHGVKDETAIQWVKAREMMDCKINEIMSCLPEGKKNKLFNLRYGGINEIKHMKIKEAFQRLGLEAKQVKLGMLAGMDYYGNTEKESVES